MKRGKNRRSKIFFVSLVLTLLSVASVVNSQVQRQGGAVVTPQPRIGQQPNRTIFQRAPDRPAANISELHFARRPRAARRALRGLDGHLPAARPAPTSPRAPRLTARPAVRWNSAEGARAGGDRLAPGSLRKRPAVIRPGGTTPIRPIGWSPNAAPCVEPAVTTTGANGGWSYPDNTGATVWYVQPLNVFPSESNARSFAATVAASMPMFLPFRDGTVYPYGGWYYGNGGYHAAIDYLKTADAYGPGIDQTFEIYSVASGKVIWTGWDDLSGNVVIIEHTAPNGDKYRSLYLHMRDGFDHDIQQAKSITVAQDEKVAGNRKWRYYQYARLANPSKEQWGTNAQTIKVSAGQNVYAGQLIGYSGNTGYGGAGWGLNDDGTPSDPNQANNHLHLFMGVPDPTPNSTKWVLVDPYGVYEKTSTGGSACYDLAQESAYVRLFAPFYPSFHNVPADIVSEYFNYYTGMGMGLQTLNLHRHNNQLLASGSFQYGLSPDWYARFGMTQDDYQYWFDEYNKQGYRPREISVAIDAGGQPRFSSIWRKRQGEGYFTFGLLTDADWMAKWKELVEKGKMRVEDHFRYGLNGQSRHAAIYVGDGVTDFYEFHDMNIAAFQAKFDELTGKGYQLVSVNAAELPAGTTFGGVWRKVPGSWYAFGEMSPSQYQSKFLELDAQGYRLHKVQGYANSSRFVAIWTK